MDDADHPQLLEITALKSIYADDFIDCPPPKAWKGAPRLPEFVIRVYHPDPQHAQKVSFHLHVKFPKTYPAIASPVFTIQQPIVGLKSDQVTKLSHAIREEAQKNRGVEIVFQVITFAQDWIAQNVTPPIEVVGSLATEMNRRASEQERAKKEREEALAEEQSLLAAARAEELNEQIRADTFRQQREREKVQRRAARRRAFSDATEIPGSPEYEYKFDNDEDGDGDDEEDDDEDADGDGESGWKLSNRDGGGGGREGNVEVFGSELEWEGVRFDRVRLFQPRQESLGTVHQAEPISLSATSPLAFSPSSSFVPATTSVTAPLEQLTVTFGSSYYLTPQGRKKLQTLEAELTRLARVRHPNLCALLAVKLGVPQSAWEPYPRLRDRDSDGGKGKRVGAGPRLVLLMEGRPRVTLEDVMEECERMREERARECLVQILNALKAVHAGDLVHRGLSLRSIGLVPKASASGYGQSSSTSKQIKLFKAGYHVRLADLNRSNPFDGPHNSSELSLNARSNTYRLAGGEGVEEIIPDGWLPKATIESPLIYTKSRDIHAVGVVLLQMVIGKDVVQQYPDVHTALIASPISPALKTQAMQMLLPPSSKRNTVSCASLLSSLSSPAPHSTPQNPPILTATRSLFSDGSFPSVHQGLARTQPREPMRIQHTLTAPDGWVVGTPRVPQMDVNFGKTGGGKGRHSDFDGDVDYFRSGGRRVRQASRWKEDWEELEMLGRGAFGSVVKARNKIDSRIYAVKKIKLRSSQFQTDSRIFREVNALSRLNHRFIVRYYTTWVEVADEPSSTLPSTAPSSSSADSSDQGGTEHPSGAENSRSGDEGEGGTTTSVPIGESDSDGTDPFRVDFDDGTDTDTGTGTDMDGGDDHHSFPSIHFMRTASTGNRRDGGNASSSSENSLFDIVFEEDGAVAATTAATVARLEETKGALMTPRPKELTETNESKAGTPTVSRILYIQMEFVERQTLKERIAEGLQEDEAWRLFQQIVDALVHMSSLSILHRDIKLTNIFIDGKGDAKIGDFGLATSSLAAVDPSDVTQAKFNDAELTLDVGTRLYIAPEVQSLKGGPRNHSKADMYSLGIVFFEMNYMFSTGSERIAVLEDLRRPSIRFPATWEPHRNRQRQIITWLLQHNPDDRPSALELSQSPLLPPRLEDEYFKAALNLMSKPDSPHLQAVLSTLFSQPAKPPRAFLYDLEAQFPEHAALNALVIDRLVDVFRLHGAVDMEPPLLMPVTNPEEDRNRPTFIDRHGELVSLPNNGLYPFARSAARSNIRRIKRYHISDIYRPNTVSGHPRMSKVAVFDIITPDLEWGPAASAAEVIAILNACLNTFANIGQHYDIHISHSRILDIAMERVAPDLRAQVIDVLNQSKSSQSQKRAILLRKGIPRNIVDELEMLTEIDEDIDAFLAKLEKVSPALAAAISAPLAEVKSTMQFSKSSGVIRPIFLNPLVMANRNPYFRDGVCFEVIRRNKRSDVLAVGGRYDNLISRLSPPRPKAETICAVGVQISLEKITAALAAFQSASVKTLLKEQRSYGYWSPRRCDVYIVMYQAGYLADRLEVAALLWQHNISADVIYESGLRDAERENPVDQCSREGILFIVYPRPRASRRDQAAFKVKSVLRGTESEVSRAELVPFLQQQIAEQRRIDISIAGTPGFAEGPSSAAPGKEATGAPDVQLILPGDAKKQRKFTKQMFLDRAFEVGVQIKEAAASGMPMLAVDVPVTVFEEMTKSSHWIIDEDAWKSTLANFPPQHAAYGNQIREAVTRRKLDGHKFLLLFAVREERVFLITLS